MALPPIQHPRPTPPAGNEILSNSYIGVITYYIELKFIDGEGEIQTIYPVWRTQAAGYYLAEDPTYWTQVVDRFSEEDYIDIMYQGAVYPTRVFKHQWVSLTTGQTDTLFYVLDENYTP